MGYVEMAMDRRDLRRARRREVAQLIRILRTRASLTQEQLAFRMSQILGQKVHRSQVSMWELPGESGQLIDTDLFLALLEATAPRDTPETPEEKQARVLRSRLGDLRRFRPPASE